jgi:hypothetical protein
MEETKSKMKKVLFLLVVLMALVCTLGLVLPSGASPALAGTPPSLVARWSFNEGSGSMAHDSSGNGNNGTIYGATWVPGASLLFGSALRFNGSSDYVSVSDSPSLNITGSISVEGWVYLSSLSQQATIAGKWKDMNNTNLRGYLLTVGTDGTPRFYVSTNGSNYPVAIGSKLSLNTWYHLAGTYDGANIKLYVGTAPVAVSQTGLIFNNSQPLLIGATDGWGGTTRKFTNGSIDEVRVWNGVLDSTQLDDMLPPVISVSGIADGATYTLGQVVTATWSAVDGTGSGHGSGVTGVAAVTATNDGVPITSGSAINTSTAGTHTLVVNATDLADNTATITVTYTVNALPSITITAPSAIDFGKFSQTNVASSLTNGTVTVTGTFTSWSVTAISAAPSALQTNGYMYNGSTVLADQFNISEDGTTWSPASTGITYTGKTTSGSLPLWASQNIEHSDRVSGDYTVTITFTGSITY